MEKHNITQLCQLIGETNSEFSDGKSWSSVFYQSKSFLLGFSKNSPKIFNNVCTHNGSNS